MRSITIIPFLLFLISTAQTAFAPIGATWVHTIHSYWQDLDYPSVAIVVGDSTIGGRSCSEIQTQGFSCSPLNMNRLFTYVSGDSVYWYDQDDAMFKLLVPFNAGVGGSWRIPLQNDTVLFAVFEVDTIQVNGVDLRREHVTQSALHGNYVMEPIAIWTERFGNDLYLVPWRNECSDADAPVAHVCYSDPTLSWPNEGVSCLVWTAQPDRFHGPSISIAPSFVPCGQEVAIRIDGPLGARAELTILDATGRMVSSRHLDDRSLPVTLEVSGVYVVILREEGRHIAQQRILVD